MSEYSEDGEVTLESMTFTQARYMTTSKALTRLTSAQAKFLDEMENPPLVSDVIDLPKAIFDALFIQDFKDGSQFETFNSFHWIIVDSLGQQKRHPYPQAAALKELTKRVKQVPEFSTEEKLEEFFKGVDHNLLVSLKRQFEELLAEFLKRGGTCNSKGFARIQNARKAFIVYGFKDNSGFKWWMHKKPALLSALRELKKASS